MRRNPNEGNDSEGMQPAHYNLKFIFCNKLVFQQKKYICLVRPIGFCKLAMAVGGQTSHRG